MQDLFLGCLHASRETCCWVSSCRPDWWPSNYLRTYMYVQLRYMYVFGYRGGGVRYRRSSHKFFFFKSARLFGTMYSTSLSMQWTGLPLRQPWAIYQHIGPVQFCLSLKIRIAL